jgi:hypothetical protein
LPGLIASINVNYHQNTYYIDYNKKLTMQSRDGINLALKHIPSIGKLRQERKVRQLRSKIHPKKSQKAPRTMKYFWIRLPNQRPTLNRLKRGKQHPRVRRKRNQGKLFFRKRTKIQRRISIKKTTKETQIQKHGDTANIFQQTSSKGE